MNESEINNSLQVLSEFDAALDTLISDGRYYEALDACWQAQQYRFGVFGSSSDEAFEGSIKLAEVSNLLAQEELCRGNPNDAKEFLSTVFKLTERSARVPQYSTLDKLRLRVRARGTETLSCLRFYERKVPAALSLGSTYLHATLSLGLPVDTVIALVNLAVLHLSAGSPSVSLQHALTAIRLIHGWLRSRSEETALTPQRAPSGGASFGSDVVADARAYPLTPANSYESLVFEEMPDWVVAAAQLSHETDVARHGDGTGDGDADNKQQENDKGGHRKLFDELARLTWLPGRDQLDFANPVEGQHAGAVEGPLMLRHPPAPLAADPPDAVVPPPQLSSPSPSPSDGIPEPSLSVFTPPTISADPPALETRRASLHRPASQQDTEDAPSSAIQLPPAEQEAGNPHLGSAPAPPRRRRSSFADYQSKTEAVAVGSSATPRRLEQAPSPRSSAPEVSCSLVRALERLRLEWWKTRSAVVASELRARSSIVKSIFGGVPAALQKAVESRNRAQSAAVSTALRRRAAQRSRQRSKQATQSPSSPTKTASPSPRNVRPPSTPPSAVQIRTSDDTSTSLVSTVKRRPPRTRQSDAAGSATSAVRSKQLESPPQPRPMKFGSVHSFGAPPPLHRFYRSKNVEPPVEEPTISVTHVSPPSPTYSPSFRRNSTGPEPLPAYLNLDNLPAIICLQRIARGLLARTRVKQARMAIILSKALQLACGLIEKKCAIKTLSSEYSTRHAFDTVHVAASSYCSDVLEIASCFRSLPLTVARRVYKDTVTRRAPYQFDVDLDVLNVFLNAIEVCCCGLSMEEPKSPPQQSSRDTSRPDDAINSIGCSPGTPEMQSEMRTEEKKYPQLSIVPLTIMLNGNSISSDITEASRAAFKISVSVVSSSGAGPASPVTTVTTNFTYSSSDVSMSEGNLLFRFDDCETSVVDLGDVDCISSVNLGFVCDVFHGLGTENLATISTKGTVAFGTDRFAHLQEGKILDIRLLVRRSGTWVPVGTLRASVSFVPCVVPSPLEIGPSSDDIIASEDQSSAQPPLGQVAGTSETAEVVSVSMEDSVAVAPVQASLVELRAQSDIATAEVSLLSAYCFRFSTVSRPSQVLITHLISSAVDACIALGRCERRVTQIWPILAQVQFLPGELAASAISAPEASSTLCDKVRGICRTAVAEPSDRTDADVASSIDALREIALCASAIAKLDAVLTYCDITRVKLLQDTPIRAVFAIVVRSLRELDEELDASKPLPIPAVTLTDSCLRLNSFLCVLWVVLSHYKATGAAAVMDVAAIRSVAEKILQRLCSLRACAPSTASAAVVSCPTKFLSPGHLAALRESIITTLIAHPFGLSVPALVPDDDLMHQKLQRVHPLRGYANPSANNNIPLSLLAAACIVDDAGLLAALARLSLSGVPNPEANIAHLPPAECNGGTALHLSAAFDSIQCVTLLLHGVPDTLVLLRHVSKQGVAIGLSKLFASSSRWAQRPSSDVDPSIQLPDSFAMISLFCNVSLAKASKIVLSASTPGTTVFLPIDHTAIDNSGATANTVARNAGSTLCLDLLEDFITVLLQRQATEKAKIIEARTSAAVAIQRNIRGFHARRKVQDLRQESCVDGQRIDVDYLDEILDPKDSTEPDSLACNDNENAPPEEAAGSVQTPRRVKEIPIPQFDNAEEDEHNAIFVRAAQRHLSDAESFLLPHKAPFAPDSRSECRALRALHEGWWNLWQPLDDTIASPYDTQCMLLSISYLVTAFCLVALGDNINSERSLSLAASVAQHLSVSSQIGNFVEKAVRCGDACNGVAIVPRPTGTAVVLLPARPTITARAPVSGLASVRAATTAAPASHSLKVEDNFKPLYGIASGAPVTFRGRADRPRAITNNKRYMIPRVGVASTHKLREHTNTKSRGQSVLYGQFDEVPRRAPLRVPPKVPSAKPGSLATWNVTFEDTSKLSSSAADGEGDDLLDVAAATLQNVLSDA